MADSEVAELEEESDRAKLKEVELEMIQRELEATEQQLQVLDRMEEDNNPLAGTINLSPEALAAKGIHVKNVMEFTATLELSAPRDVSKMYNFSGLKSNLPRDDINLQFCRGQLKLKKNMLQDMMQCSRRKKSLLDPQTLLLLRTQEESHLVAEKTDFWRRAAILHLKDKKPQSEQSPEWLAEYRKDKLDILQQASEKFWKEVEAKVKEAAATKQAIKITNRQKMVEKEEQWQASLSDDSWYRAPQFHPEGSQSRRTDIEVLCEIIYGHGEKYEDGTAAIGFTWLFKMFNRANIVGILIKAKKHGLVYFDGEIVFASVRSEDDDEFVVLQKPIGEVRRAFNEMRSRHADMFQFDGKRRATIIVPQHGEQNNAEDEEEESENSLGEEEEEED